MRKLPLFQLFAVVEEVTFCAGTDSSGERAIIHLDMDCFFASVASLAEPAFKGKPLAVSHSNSAQGTGEISSANYEARKFGIRASMFIAEAKKRCPHLIVMPYQFDKYEEVSEQVSLSLTLYCPLAALTLQCTECFLVRVLQWTDPAHSVPILFCCQKLDYHSCQCTGSTVYACMARSHQPLSTGSSLSLSLLYRSFRASHKRLYVCETLHFHTLRK